MKTQQLDDRICWEVLQILNLLGNTYIERLPESIYEEIKRKSSKNKNLTNSNISREAIVIIATMHSNFWVDSEEERKELDDIFKINQEKYQNDISEKYNTNIFDNTKKKKNLEETREEQQLIIKPKEKWYYKLWIKIKKIIRR
jgi:hypothetical protein